VTGSAWQYRAACRGADPDLFFPQQGESADPARRVCARCPVRAQCLEYALANAIWHGVWGGLAERERRELRTRRLRAARRDRDRAIAAAAGHPTEAVGRAADVSGKPVRRVLAGEEDAGERPG